jgi:hypothetical protein
MEAQVAGLLAEQRVLASFQHKGVSGIEREQPIRRFLENHLPSRFLVGQGSVASAETILETQHDIIVADRDSCFSLLNTVSAQLVAIESVHLIVEVRTNFGDITGVTDSLQAVRQLRPCVGIRQFGARGSETGQTAPPVQTLIVYEGPTEDTALRHFKAANDTCSSGRMPIDSILVLSRTGQGTPESGYLIGYARTDPSTGDLFAHHYYPEIGQQGLDGPKVVKSGSDSFAYWYAGVLNHLSGVIAYPPILYAYLGEHVQIMPWSRWSR